MAKYLFQVNFTEAGLKGLMKEGGTKRVEALTAAAKSLNGKLEAYYFALGERDAYLILDFPDNVSVSALALVANSAGTAQVSTTVLITPEEVDKAVKMNPAYRAPGQ